MDINLIDIVKFIVKRIYVCSQCLVVAFEQLKNFTHFPITHELRNEIKQSKQAIVGMKEDLSSVKAKKVSGREERGEKKKSKLRGGVESAGTCLTRVLNTKEGISSRSQRRMRRPFHTVSETHMAGMQHRLSVTNARCEAADGPSPLQAGKQEHLQKEQTGRMLRSSHECQAKNVRKGGRQAMNSDGKRQGIGWTSVTGEALMPRETPMRTLSSGLSFWRFALVLLLLLQRSRRKHDGL